MRKEGRLSEIREHLLQIHTHKTRATRQDRQAPGRLLSLRLSFSSFKNLSFVYIVKFNMRLCLAHCPYPAGSLMRFMLELFRVSLILVCIWYIYYVLYTQAKKIREMLQHTADLNWMARIYTREFINYSRYLWPFYFSAFHNFHHVCVLLQKYNWLIKVRRRYI